MSQGTVSPRQTLLTPEEYLERELTSPVKHEFVDGNVYAMAGGTARHNLIAVNLLTLINSHLPDRCSAFTADMKLRLRMEAATVFYYPDLMVSCTAEDQTRHYIEEPVLLVEVLSPSTERIDRTEKFDAYRRLPSLEEYVLADQDMPKIEVFRRRTAWSREEVYPDDSFKLDSVGLELTVSQVYRRVRF